MASTMAPVNGGALGEAPGADPQAGFLFTFKGSAGTLAVCRGVSQES